MEQANRKDPQELELSLDDQVIYGALTTLAREVGHRLKRAAHSSIIRESDDYGAAIVSANFELLAEAEQLRCRWGRYCPLSWQRWSSWPPCGLPYNILGHINRSGIPSMKAPCLKMQGLMRQALKTPHMLWKTRMWQKRLMLLNRSKCGKQGQPKKRTARQRKQIPMGLKNYRNPKHPTWQLIQQAMIRHMLLRMARELLMISHQRRSPPGMEVGNAGGHDATDGRGRCHQKPTRLPGWPLWMPRFSPWTTS